MNPRWAGFAAPFRWLVDAVDVGRHQPGVVLGAIATVVLVGVLPSLPVQLMGLGGASPGTAAVMLSNLVGFALSLAVMPVLKAGLYRILDRADAGQPVAVAQVFEGFRDGSWGRLVGCALLGLAMFAAVFVVMMLCMAVVVGAEALQALQPWLAQVQALQASAASSGQPVAPGALPPPPEGLGGILGVLIAFLPLWCVVGLAAAWALVSVALRNVSPTQAIVAGLRAALLNAGPVLVAALLLALPTFLVSLLLALVVVAVVAVASLLGPIVAGMVMMALVLALSVVLTAIGYAFVLQGWRATCDAGTGASDAPPPVVGLEA